MSAPVRRVAGAFTLKLRRQVRVSVVSCRRGRRVVLRESAVHRAARASKMLKLKAIQAAAKQSPPPEKANDAAAAAAAPAAGAAPTNGAAATDKKTAAQVEEAAKVPHRARLTTHPKSTLFSVLRNHQRPEPQERQGRCKEED